MYAHRKCMEGRRKSSPKYDEALHEMSENTLKVFNGELARNSFRKHRRAFNMPGGLYFTQQFGKCCVLQHQTK